MKRILFNLKANNAHGLHSPLVYALYTQVINPIYASNLNFETTLIERIKIFFQFAQTSQPRIYSIEIPLNNTYINSLFLNSKNIIIFKNIRNTKAIKHWKALIQNQKIIFSIELFELGIILLDPIAPKQHFILKKSRIK